MENGIKRSRTGGPSPEYDVMCVKSGVEKSGGGQSVQSDVRYEQSNCEVKKNKNCPGTNSGTKSDGKICVQPDRLAIVKQTNKQNSVLDFFKQNQGDQDQDLLLAKGLSSTESTQSNLQDTEEGGVGFERERESLSGVETTNSGRNRPPVYSFSFP